MRYRYNPSYVVNGTVLYHSLRWSVLNKIKSATRYNRMLPWRATLSSHQIQRNPATRQSGTMQSIIHARSRAGR
jgi:hypothetical protein